MRISVGTLRRLISEALREVPGPNSRDDASNRPLDQELDEMKLGVAEPNPPGRYFGKPESDDERELGPRLMQDPKPEYDPGPNWRGSGRRAANYAHWDEDDDSDINSWLRGNGDTKVGSDWDGADDTAINVDFSDADTRPDTNSRK